MTLGGGAQVYGKDWAESWNLAASAVFIVFFYMQDYNGSIMDLSGIYKGFVRDL